MSIITGGVVIAMMSLPTLDEKQLDCLALNVYHESRSERVEGQIAVAQVTLNRVAHNEWPSTICEVVYQGLRYQDGQMKRNKCQFSWYCDGKSDRIPSTQMHNFENAQDIAYAMLLEYELRQTRWLGITEGATHYHATYVVPNWVHDRGMKRKKQIGKHIFYKFN